MKLKHLMPQNRNDQLVRQFGQAVLVRQRNGQHQLIGGTASDRAAAFEWASLFAHEIVFTHSYVRTHRSSRISLLLPVLAAAH